MMEKFDFEVEEPVARVRRRPKLLDVLTVLVLLLTFAIGAFLLFVFINPQTPYNPLYPNIPTAFAFPTLTGTPLQMEATWTPTFVNATVTPTLAPTFTLEPSSTVVSFLPPSITPRPIATSGPPYSAKVSWIANTLFHPESDCQWLGIGGTVVDSHGAAVLYLTLRLTGSLNDQPVEKLTVSGTAPAYGPAGFEFKLGTTPVDSNTLRLQLFDQSGVPQADEVSVVTYKDCSKNLSVISFLKNH